jgi:hypothetical protein
MPNHKKNSAANGAARQLGERGMASIIITTVLISVVGLIIIGFSLVVRRNQRETLDRQLSVQAYYAAETAVNDARARAEAELLATGSVTQQSNCSGAAYPTPSLGVSGVAATCVMVNGSLVSMSYSSVVEGKDTIVPVIPTLPASVISTITITWRVNNGAAANPQIGCGGVGGGLPLRSSWSCGYGLMRADIIDTIRGGNTATTAFLVPNNGGAAGSLAFSPTGGGRVVTSGCSAVECRAVINVSSVQAPGKAYYMRLRSIYKDSSVSVSARDAANNPIRLSGQILIDSTGKSQDVLRRIQVRVPVMKSSDLVPFGAIESTGSICKRFMVAPGYLQGGLPGNELCM